MDDLKNAPDIEFFASNDRLVIGQFEDQTGRVSFKPGLVLSRIINEVANSSDALRFLE